MAMPAKSRNQIIGAIITGIFIIFSAIISSPHWFNLFFPDQYVEQEEVSPIVSTRKNKNVKSTESIDSSEVSSGTENLVIENIELCPINSLIPSYLFVEIKNSGTKKLNNLEIDIDLGRARFQQIDIIKPNNNISSIDNSTSNRIILQYSKFEENESIIIYTLLSQPVFNSIKLSGSNLVHSKEYTYQNYVDSKLKNKSGLSAYVIFLLVLLGVILIVLTIYFLNVIYTFLKRWLNWY